MSIRPPSSSGTILTAAPASTNRVGIIGPDPITGGSGTAWPAADRALFRRFWLPVAVQARYFLLRLAVSSGNYQVGVVKLAGASDLDYTRVMDSGVVAAPTAGDLRIDLGSTLLEAGSYALFLWANNITISVPNATSASYTARRIGAEVSALATGVPATGSLSAWNGSRFFDAYLEGDV